MRHEAVSIVLAFILFLILYTDYTNHEYIFRIEIDRMKFNFTGSDDFIPPYINIVSDLFVSQQFKIAACGIRKSMSQLTINTMCILHDTTNALNKLSMNDTWKNRSVCHLSDEQFRKIPTNLTSDDEFLKIAFIRDPFDRFLSFFLDKCVNENSCWNCRDDMQCVVKRLYKSLLRFKVHPDYKATYDELHGAPLSWNCNFNTNLSSYHLLMIGSRKEQRKSAIIQLGNILTSRGVPEGIVKTIIDGALNGETSHGTHNSLLREKVEIQLKTDPIVREYLHKIYLFDYLIFPFDRDALDEKYRSDFFWKHANLFS